MAAQLLLVRRDDLISDVDSLSLYGFSAGINLAEGGFSPQVASPSDQSVTEALTLRISGTSMDNLAANLQALDLKLKQAAWYADPQELYGVWLRAQQLGETNARQALVLSAKRSQVPLWEAAARDSFLVHDYGVALERMPYWESTAAVEYNGLALTAINSLGGTWDYTTAVGSPGAVPGDMPARIASCLLEDTSGTKGPLTKVWVGFRTNRFGTRANFVPVWNAHFSVDAVRSDADTTKVADATTQDGSKTTTSFATVATMLRRVLLRVSDAAPANYSDQRGTFMVLLRAKLSAGGSSVNVRLEDGYITAINMGVRGRVNITSTSYYLYEMGTVRIPGPGRTIPGFDIRNYAMAIDAERISGAASLDMDCLILIPTDEGYFTTEQPNTTGTQGIGGAATNSAVVMEKPDGALQGAYLDQGITPSDNLVVRYSQGLPTGSGLLVVAAQRYQSSVKTDTIQFDFNVYARWTTLRGAS